MNTDRRQHWPSLPRLEVVKALQRQNPSRIPLIRAKWWGEGLREQYGRRLDTLQRYPEDTAMVWVEPLNVHAMGLSWDVIEDEAHDARVVLDDWAKLEEFTVKAPLTGRHPVATRHCGGPRLGSTRGLAGSTA